MNRKSGKLNSLLRMVLGLCCTANIYAAIYPEDPNTPARSEVLRREIMESQIQPLYLSITSVTETDLDALINNLSRLEVPAGQEPEPQASASTREESQEPARKATLPEPEANPAASEEKNKPAETKEASEIIVPDPKWLVQIDEVGQPVNPMSLGDVMFKMDQLERAERFYRLVLEKTTSSEDSDWQWAMYQRANCLRRNKPAEARKLYVELLEKAPGSSWSGSASAQLATLDWYAGGQASKLENYLSDPNSIP